MAEDSTLSITANVIGILTFAVTIILGAYARVIAISQVEQVRLLRIEVLEAVEVLNQNYKDFDMIARAVAQSHGDKAPLKPLLEAGYTGVSKTMFALTDLLVRSTVQQALEGDGKITNLRKWLKEVESSKLRLFNQQSIMWQSELSESLQALVDLQRRENNRLESLLRESQQHTDAVVEHIKVDIHCVQSAVAQSLGKLEATQLSVHREAVDISGLGEVTAEPASPAQLVQDSEEEASSMDPKAVSLSQPAMNNPAKSQSTKSASIEPQTPTGSQTSRRKTAEGHVTKEQASSSSDSSDSNSCGATRRQPRPQPQVERQTPAELVTWQVALQPEPELPAPLQMNEMFTKCMEDGFSAYLATLPEHERRHVNFNPSGAKTHKESMGDINRAVQAGFGRRTYRFFEGVIRFFLPSPTRKLIEDELTRSYVLNAIELMWRRHTR